MADLKPTIDNKIWELGTNTKKPLKLRFKGTNEGLKDAIKFLTEYNMILDENILSGYLYVPRDEREKYLSYQKQTKLVYNQLLQVCLETSEDRYWKPDK